MKPIRLAIVAGMVLALDGCSGRNWPAPVVDRAPRAPAAKSAPAAKPTPPAKPASVAKPAPADGTYVVKRGDTLYSIALEHGVEYREVAQWNRLGDPTKISVGQVLRVKPPPEPVQIGSVRIGAGVESRPIDAPATPAPAAAPAPPAIAKSDAVNFMWPVKGKVLSAFAEPRSKGIDIDGKMGDPVVAAAAGRVTYIGNGIPGLGKLVVIKHDQGFITVYAHNRQILVKEQQPVTRGQKIAEIGSTDADRPKLHFQIRKGAAAVDPLRYLPGS